MKRVINISVLVLFLGFVISCTTTDHLVAVKPFDVETPVSASGYYLNDSGNIVSPGGYEVVNHFELIMENSGPIADSLESMISFDAEIQEQIALHDGDAVVNLQVYGIDYDPGKTFLTGFTRIFGGMMSGFGGMFLIMGLVMDDGLTSGLGLGFGLTGAVSLGISYFIPKSSESIWTVGIEGDIVRER
jgi:hypothetical protein